MTNTNYQASSFSYFTYLIVAAISCAAIYAVAYGWGWETSDPYGECVTKYTSDVAGVRAERETMVSSCTKTYPSDIKGLTSCLANPKPYPKMECDNISIWTHSTGTTVPPPKWIEKPIKKVEVINPTPEKKSVSIVEKKDVDQTVSSGTSSSSKNKYWEAYWIAIKLIKKYEWIRLKAYHDYWVCSIWWWTRAKSCSEKITQAEADRRLWSIVQTITKNVQSDFPHLNSNQTAALVSFAFNCHSGYVDVKRNWIKYHSRWCKTVTIGWKKKTLAWLVKRRAEESKLLLN